nr:hypothetical protein [Tanacetum cinerariifolium]
MESCTTLQTRVLELEKTKTSQHNEIASLKKWVKKFEKRNRSRTHKLKILYKVSLTARVESSNDEESLGEDASTQGRIEAIDTDEDITLVNVQDGAEMFDVDDLGGEEVFVAEQEVVKDVNENVVEEVVNASQDSTTTTTITTEEITLDKALKALKTSKPKGKGLLYRNKKSQIDADHQLGERLQAQEQEELFDAKKATLFQQRLEKRRKVGERQRKESRRRADTREYKEAKGITYYCWVNVNAVEVSIARTSSTEQPPLKDKSRCNKTAKDIWDALAMHMLGSEYGEQDRKAAVLVKCYNCKKEGHFAKDCKKVKVKDYEYYKTKMLLAKKDKDEQVLLAEDQAWMESSSDSDQEINANMVFIAPFEKVLFDSETSSSSTDEKIYEASRSCKSFEKEKVNLETIKSLKSKGFESSETAISKSENQNKNNCLVVENKRDKEENSKVITPGMYKLSVSQSVSQISMSKTSCDSKNADSKLKRKRRKRKTSKQNDKQVNNDVSRANSNFVHFLDLDTFSSVRRPKNSGVIWKKKGLSNTFNVDLSAVNLLKFNKNVKRYSRNDLLACNNSHLGETRSDFVCNDAMNVSYDSRMNDLLDDNNFFIFDDESVKISPVSKMPFRKKPCDSINARFKSNMIKSSPRTVHKWLPKLQLLAEPIAKWFPRVKRQIDKTSKTPNSLGPIYKWVPKVC